MAKSLVWCKIPKAGLGNQLFVILRAALFSTANKLPIVYTNYNQLKLGPYLRNEKSKRKYSSFFNFYKNPFFELIDKVKIFGSNLPIVDEDNGLLQPKGIIYKFSQIPHWSDYFKDLKNHRRVAIKIFYDLLREDIKREIDGLEMPVIGIHIRRGDFRDLQAGENFKDVGAVRTPLQYFKELIFDIRKLNGFPLPVTIFSDGYDNELQELLVIENVKRSSNKPDIVDMLLLSRSKIIVASAGSTFSYWAGFLSNAPIIMHPDHLHASIRDINDGFYQGYFDETSNYLVRYIKSLNNE
jgi:hypothetical protein